MMILAWMAAVGIPLFILIAIICCAMDDSLACSEIQDVCRMLLAILAAVAVIALIVWGWAYLSQHPGSSKTPLAEEAAK